MMMSSILAGLEGLGWAIFEKEPNFGTTWRIYKVPIGYALDMSAVLGVIVGTVLYVETSTE